MGKRSAPVVSKRERRRVQISFTRDMPRAQQHFKESCDINNIIRKYRRAGVPINAGAPAPRFGDVSDLPNYWSAMTLLQEAGAAFEALPSHVRDRFGNDPAKLIEFLEKDGNRAEAFKLGLISKDPSAVAPADGKGLKDESKS